MLEGQKQMGIGQLTMAEDPALEGGNIKEKNVHTAAEVVVDKVRTEGK